MAAKTKAKKAERPPDGPTAVDCLLTRADVRAALRISERTLSSYLQTGDFPAPDTHIGRRPRWRTSTLNGWIARRCEGA